MASQPTNGTASVLDVGQAPGGPIHLSSKPSASPQVLSDWLPAFGGLQHPVPVVDGDVSLHLSTHSSPGEVSDQDQRGGSGGDHRHRTLLAEEILVPPSPPDDVQDPSPSPTQMGFHVTPA